MAQKVVFESLHANLITGDDGRRQNNGIAIGKSNRFVLFLRDAHQGRRFFALRTGRDDDDLVCGVVGNGFRGNNGSGLRRENISALGNFQVRFYGAALGHYFFAKFFCHLDDFYHPFKLAGEGADNETAFHGPYDFFYRFIDARFGNGKAVLFRVRGIRDEKQVFVAAQRSPVFEFLFRRHAVMVLKAQVARNHDVAVLGLDGESHGIRNGVGDGERLYRDACLCRLARRGRQAAYYDSASRFHDIHFKFRQMRELFLPLFDHQGREVLRIDGRIADAVYHVRDAADVV